MCYIEFPFSFILFHFLLNSTVFFVLNLKIKESVMEKKHSNIFFFLNLLFAKKFHMEGSL